mgnify:CR=1 FL=1
MLLAQPRSLLQRLSPFCTRALETAASNCVTGGHDEVSVEHVLIALIEAENSDVQIILNHYGADGELVLGQLRRALMTNRRSTAGRPVFSRLLLEWVQDTWVFASLEMRATELRSGTLLARFLEAPERYSSIEITELRRVRREELSREMDGICAASSEAPRAAAGPDGAENRPIAASSAAARDDGPLEKFTLDLTAKEFQLLAFFMRHPRHVLSRTRIFDAVWDDHYDGLSNTLEVHVKELRRKLEACGQRIIQTRRGRGYVLDADTSDEN